ncbi:MAG: hypothetical protein BWY62_01223 [Firmicutes bacterium ADurb.Bin356]|nr:MAG: hypothetical protein BWY62_01223 [Firmicutes bacterium ADurb.Bin356]
MLGTVCNMPKTASTLLPILRFRVNIIPRGTAMTTPNITAEKESSTCSKAAFQRTPLFFCSTLKKSFIIFILPDDTGKGFNYACFRYNAFKAVIIIHYEQEGQFLFDYYTKGIAGLGILVYSRDF